MRPHGRREALLALVLALVLVGGLLALAPVRDAVSAALHGDTRALRDQTDDLGAGAALLLVGLSLVHVLVPFPTELPNAAAGFAFGWAAGTALMIAAWTLSGLAAYALARTAGRPLLLRVAGPRRLEAAERLVARGGVGALLAARLIPLVPFSLASFACGATRVPLGRFTWTTAVGAAPLTAFVALLGTRLEEFRADDPLLWVAVLGVVALLALSRPLARRFR